MLFQLLSTHAQVLTQGSVDDAALKRCRRVLVAMAGIAADWQGDVGLAPGPALAECAARFLGGRPQQPDVAILTDVLDQVFSLLTRIVQLRFSHALQAETYAAIERCRELLGIGLWTQCLTPSRNVTRIRTNLLESVLVLARQNRTDKNLVSVLSLVYASKVSAIAGVRQHFTGASDLDPEVRRWWESLGASPVGHGDREHKVGNSEDEQIGVLLLEAEGAREAMEKVGRAIVPYLNISDPVLAATTKRAVAGYVEMAQIVNRLARMRRLAKTNLRGERIEFNPLEHQMLGEGRTGVRTVRVVRDGIQKDFGGRLKTIIKPWVEPEE